MSDPKHFDHILPFLQQADVHHTIPLTAQEVVRMHAKDDVPVAVGASDLQTDRISRLGEHSLSPTAASSSPQQSRATRSATTASKPHDTSPLSFPDSGESVQVRSKESEEKDVVYLSPQDHKRFKHGREVHLQHNFNISNHSSLHRRSHITNLFSPCPKVSGTTPKTYRSWSRKRITLRALGTLNVTLSLPGNCANRRRFNCLRYEERPPLQTIKITCRIFSAKSSTAL
jgi:hypothetical protein